MSGPPTYGQDAGALDEAVKARAARTVRRHALDADDRQELLDALGLPDEPDLDEGQAHEDNPGPDRRHPDRPGHRQVGP